MRLSNGFLATSIFILSGCAITPPSNSAIGEWSGKLETGAQTLTLVVDINEDKNGQLAGHLETPEQVPGKEFPFDLVQSVDGTLQFELHQMGAAYEGTWNSEERAWDGSWLQAGLELPLVLTQGRPELSNAIEGLDGKWDGHVMRGNTKVLLTIRVRTVEGVTMAKFASPTNGIEGLPIQGLERTGDMVKFDIPASGASYRGTLSTDGASITGDWSFRGKVDKVTFTKN